MRVRRDILVAGLLILLCALAVVWQLGVGPFGDGPEADIVPVELGAELTVDFDLRDAAARPGWHRLQALYGPRATVLYTWSVPCPCIQVVEPRLQALHARFGREQGVAWVALAGEPEDTPEQIRRKMTAVGAFYRMLLDPEQQICRRLGFDRACQVAVLDGAGRLVYRGALDGDYLEGQAEYLAEALDAVVAGRAPAVSQRPHAYGCEFADPASCREYERP